MNLIALRDYPTLRQWIQVVAAAVVAAAVLAVAALVVVAVVAAALAWEQNSTILDLVGFA